MKARLAGAILAAIVFALPVVWMIGTSFKPAGEIGAASAALLPRHPTLIHYAWLIESRAWSLALNSLIVTAGTTVLALAAALPAAYALARLPVPGSNVFLLLVLAAQMFPAIVIVIPLFIAASKLGLIDTRLNLILVYLSFNLPVVIWVLRGFFAGIPQGLERAARIDGAGIVQTFLLIILPISWPPLFAAAVFAFIEAWNEFFFALIMTRQSSQTVPLVISAFAGQYQTVFGQMMAAAAISIAPVIILAILLRNHILRGFADGILKG